MAPDGAVIRRLLLSRGSDAPPPEDALPLLLSSLQQRSVPKPPILNSSTIAEHVYEESSRPWKMLGYSKAQWSAF